MYQTINVIIRPCNRELYGYFDSNCRLAKNIYNATLFRCRQILSADRKAYDGLTDNELEVLREFDLLESKYSGNRLTVPSYYRIDRVYKLTCNPDYRNGLPIHGVQHVIKEVVQCMKSYFSSIKSYRSHPDRFRSVPKLPHYIKSDRHGYKISNQESCFRFTKQNICKLRLPKTRLMLTLGRSINGRLVEVNVQPFYDSYKISVVTESDVSIQDYNKTRMIGIDTGINGFAAVNNNCGLTPFIINGRPLKSYNQWYNMTMTKLQSYSSVQNGSKHVSVRMNRLYRDRYNHTRDFYNKSVSVIMKYCRDNNMGTVVIGKNDGWKQGVNLGHGNNQAFTAIAHSVFINKLISVGKKYGIDVIPVEESYTSKASLIDGDGLPAWNENHPDCRFSGRRIKRGLYKTKNGTLIHADINGAGNIIKKMFPDAFACVKNMDYMTKSVRLVNV